MKARHCGLVVVGCAALLSCGPEQQWEVASTGFHNAFAYWCDSDHLAVSYGLGKQNFYVDANESSNRQAIELVDENGNRRPSEIWGCEDNVLLIQTPVDEGQPTHYSDHNDLYLLPVGGKAKLIATLKDQGFAGPNRLVSISGKVIAASMPYIGKDGAPGYAVDPECTSFALDEFHVVCVNERLSTIIALRRFVVAQHVWQNGAPARFAEGTIRTVSASDPTGLQAGYYLRDLKGQVLASLQEDPTFRTGASYVANPDETFLYSGCVRKSERSPHSVDRVCRYQLDGSAHQWQEVFAFERVNEWRASIQDVSIDEAGNVFFDLPGLEGKNGGIWRFDATSQIISQVAVGRGPPFDRGPISSLDGRKVFFQADGVLQIAKRRM